jgi:2-iminobutanoate/2-iminopropanoate deaminase
VRTLHTDFFGRPHEYTPWSAGIIVPAGSDLLFTPGLTARDAEGHTVAPGDIVGQTERVFAQLEAVLGQAGADLNAVAKLTVYLQSMDDAVAVQRVRNVLWPVNPPVSSTFEVQRLASDEIRIEIEAVAVLRAAC